MISTSTPKKIVISNPTSQCIICGVFVGPRERVSVFGKSACDMKGTISRIMGGDLQISPENHFVCINKCFPKLKKVEKMYTNLKHLEEELLLSIKTNNSRNNVRTKRLNSSSDEARKFLTSEDATSKTNSSKKALFPAGKESKTYGSLVAVGERLTAVVVRALPVCVTVTNAKSSAEFPVEQGINEAHHAVNIPPSSNTCARNRSSEAPAASAEASQSPVVQVS